MFLCELALEMGMPVSEMCSRMSAHELCVIWPAYYGVKRREAKREQDEQDMKSKRTFGGGAR